MVLLDFINVLKSSHFQGNFSTEAPPLQNVVLRHYGVNMPYVLDNFRGVALSMSRCSESSLRWRRVRRSYLQLRAAASPEQAVAGMWISSVHITLLQRCGKGAVCHGRSADRISRISRDNESKYVLHNIGYDLRIISRGVTT